MKTLKLLISISIWALWLFFCLGHQMTNASDAQRATVEYRFDGMLGPMLPPVHWEFNQLNSIAIAPDGNVWVEDYGNNVFYRLNADDGSIVGQFKRPEPYPGYPKGLAVAVDGSLWTNSSGSLNDAPSLQHLKADGSIITKFATSASVIQVAKNGGIWVEDRNGSISHFSSEDTLLSKFENNCADFDQAVNPKGGVRSTDGSLWVVDANNQHVQHLNADGSIILEFGNEGNAPGQFRYPSAIALATDGTVWVVDWGNHRIQHFKSNGSFIGQIGHQGDKAGQFNYPADIVFAKDGSLWVSDSRNHRLQHLTVEGDFIEQIGGTEFGTGYLYWWPSVLALAPDGSLWVATDEKVIHHFNTNGKLIGQIKGDAKFFFYHIKDIIFTADGSLWVQDFLNVEDQYQRILHFTADGIYIEGLFGNSKSCSTNRIGQLSSTSKDIAQMPDGSVWVVDTDNHRIQHFDARWNFLALIGAASGSAGTAPSQFNNPTAIAVAKDNSLWVVDKDNYRLQHFTADGIFIGQLGSKGSAPGQFIDPRDVALTADGSFWVTDTGNRRIQKFTPQGRFIKQYGRLNDGLEAIYESPTRFSFAADGTIWLGNVAQSALLHISADGDAIELLGSGTSADFGHYPVPDISTSAADGSQWREDVGNHRIQRVNPNGNIIAQTGIEGQQSGQLSTIKRIETAKDGSVWVADVWSECLGCLNIIPMKTSPIGRAGITVYHHRLQHFTSDGVFTTMIDSGLTDNSKNFITEPDGSLWLIKSEFKTTGSSGYYEDHIHHIDINGRMLQQIGGYGQDIGQFKGIGGLAKAADGALWVLDSGNKRIQKFAPQTQLNLSAEYYDQFELLILYDVNVAGSHYQATLHYQDGLYKLLSLNPASNWYSHPAGFDEVTNILTIPLVHVYGLEYQASLKLVDNGLFQLLLATPK